HILLPPLHDIRTIAERMKSIDTHITLSANMQGDLTLRVRTDAVRVETFFKDLINPDPTQVDVSQQPSMTRAPDLFAEARVDVKDFVKFLQSSIVHPKNVVCCIAERIGLILYVYLG
ncbi:checkpoint protein Hus1/Mec3, partial [Blyttiomyces helicus]